MALLFMEGFDWLDNGTTSTSLQTAISQKWGPEYEVLSGTDANIIAGCGGNGQALALRETSHYVRFHLPNTPLATDEVGVSFWFKYNQGTGVLGSGVMMKFLDTNNTTYHLNLRMSTKGQLQLYRWNTLLTTFTDVTFGNDQWYHIAMKCVINDTTGSWQVKIDDVTVGSASGTDTRDGTGNNGIIGSLEVNGIQNGSASNDDASMYDSIVCWNDNGGDLVDFPGKTHVRTKHPDVDGDDEQWALSSGVDSYALVNETYPWDDDSDYLEDSTTSNRTLLNYEAVETRTAYHGIQVNSVVRETDGTDFTHINTLKQNSVLYPQSGQAIAGQTYENLYDVLDQDPNTSLAWTESGLNALQVGVKVG